MYAIGFHVCSPSVSRRGSCEALALKCQIYLVYKVKSKNKARTKVAKKAVVVKKKRVARKKATRNKVTRPSVSALSAKDLFEAKKLVDKLGSIDGARKAIETLEQLR